MTDHTHPPTPKHEITLTAEQHELRVQVHAQASALTATLEQLRLLWGEHAPRNQFRLAMSAVKDAVDMVDDLYVPDLDDEAPATSSPAPPLTAEHQNLRVQIGQQFFALTSTLTDLFFASGVSTKLHRDELLNEFFSAIRCIGQGVQMVEDLCEFDTDDDVTFTAE